MNEKLSLLQEILASPPNNVTVFVSFNGDNSLTAVLLLAAVVATLIVLMRNR